MKYFFLADGWSYKRIWEFGGIWNETTWRRKPEIKRLNCGIFQQGETLWLYQVEDAVLMVEVTPDDILVNSNIGQVVLKRLISAEEALDILTQSEIVSKK